MRFILILLLLTMSSKAEDLSKVYDDSLKAVYEDPELEGLQWNRYVNGNFTILSIDDRQGLWLYNNIDKIFDHCSNRWGIESKDLKQECRIFCVPDQTLLKKLFNLEKSKSDVRRNEDESISINVVWLCMEGFDEGALLPHLTHISFVNNHNYPLWFLRGSVLLSYPPKDVAFLLRQGITTGLFRHELVQSCEEILSLDYEEFNNLTEANKECFDSQSILLCMMLRKELGQTKLVSLLKDFNDKDLSNNFKFVYGYKDLEDLNLKYNSYCNDFLKETNLNKVPEYYFLIKEAE